MYISKIPCLFPPAFGSVKSKGACGAAAVHYLRALRHFNIPKYFQISFDNLRLTATFLKSRWRRQCRS